MSQINTREVVLLAAQTVITNLVGPDINMIQGWQAALVSVNANTTTGTSPTFDVYIQKKLGQPAATDLVGNPPTGTAIYDDVLHFSQLTTNATRISAICTGPLGISTVSTAPTVTTVADWAQSDAALAAGTLRIGPLGGLWRVKVVVGGTSPSATLAVTAQLIPFST